MAIAALVLVGVLGLEACGKGSAGKPLPVRLSFAEHLQDAPVLIALEKGFFRQEGLDVSPIPHGAGKECLKDVIEGRADFGTVADLPMALAAAAGERRFAVLATFESSGTLTFVVSRKDRGIRTPTDLKGKRIAVTRGTSGEFFLHSFLVFHRIRPEDVTIVDVAPGDIPKAVVAGETDACATWHPHAFRLLSRLGENGARFLGGEVFVETFNLVAKPDLIQENSEAVKRVLKALIRTETFIRENPAEARRIVSRRLSLDEAFLASVWKDMSFNVVLEQSLVIVMEAQARWAMGGRPAESGARSPNFPDYMQANPLEAVKPGSTTLIR